MRTPASFDRWQPHGGDTLAYRLLRNDIAHINTFCWNGYGVVNHAQRTLALSSQEGPVSTILHYGKDPGHRSNTPIAEVQAQLHDVDNWMRLAVVVFCASCLELFIRRIVRLALQSDPGL